MHSYILKLVIVIFSIKSESKLLLTDIYFGNDIKCLQQLHDATHNKFEVNHSFYSRHYYSCVSDLGVPVEWMAIETKKLIV